MDDPDDLVHNQICFDIFDDLSGANLTAMLGKRGHEVIHSRSCCGGHWLYFFQVKEFMRILRPFVALLPLWCSTRALEHLWQKLQIKKFQASCSESRACRLATESRAILVDYDSGCAAETSCQVDWHMPWQKPKLCLPMLWHHHTAPDGMCLVYRL